MTQDSNFLAALKNDNKTMKSSGLLNRRQQHSAYLQNLELPSLPPLSQLLPINKQQQQLKQEQVKKKKNVTDNLHALPPTEAAPQLQQAPLVQSQQPVMQPNTFSNANVAAAAAAMAAGMIPTYASSQVPGPPTQVTATTAADMGSLVDPVAVVFPPASSTAAATTTATTAPTTHIAATTNAIHPMHAVTLVPTATVVNFNDNSLTTTALTTNSKNNTDNAMTQFSHNRDTTTLQPHRTSDPFITAYNQQQPFDMLPPQQASTNAQAANGVQRYRSNSQGEKTYSFVSIPGTNQKKRPRRRYDEIERLYHCNYQDCTKSYGTLNHLNAHITMQKHGPKRSPDEFKEMRKKWREQKKLREGKTTKSKKKTNKQLQQQQLQAGEKAPTLTLSATQQQRPSVFMKHQPPVAIERLSFDVGYPSFIPSTAASTANTDAFMGSPATSMIPNMQPLQPPAPNAFY